LIHLHIFTFYNTLYIYGVKTLLTTLSALFLFTLPMHLIAQDNKPNEESTDFVGFSTPQKVAERQNVIKTSPVPFLVGQIPICGEIRITYERAINRHHSVLIGASYSYPGLLLAATFAMDTNGYKVSDYKINGVRGMLGYRCYPLKKKKMAPAGFFFGPYVSYNMVQIMEKGYDDYQRIHYFNATMTVGYQIIKKNGFSFEFFGGLGYRKNFTTGYDAYYKRYTAAQQFNFIDAPIPFLNHVKFALQINMGYAF